VIKQKKTKRKKGNEDKLDKKKSGKRKDKKSDKKKDKKKDIKHDLTKSSPGELQKSITKTNDRKNQEPPPPYESIENQNDV